MEAILYAETLLLEETGFPARLLSLKIASGADAIGFLRCWRAANEGD